MSVRGKTNSAQLSYPVTTTDAKFSFEIVSSAQQSASWRLMHLEAWLCNMTFKPKCSLKSMPHGVTSAERNTDDYDKYWESLAPVGGCPQQQYQDQEKGTSCVMCDLDSVDFFFVKDKEPEKSTIMGCVVQENRLFCGTLIEIEVKSTKS